MCGNEEVNGGASKEVAMKNLRGKVVSYFVWFVAMATPGARSRALTKQNSNSYSLKGRIPDLVSDNDGVTTSYVVYPNIHQDGQFANGAISIGLIVVYFITELSLCSRAWPRKRGYGRWNCVEIDRACLYKLRYMLFYIHFRLMAGAAVLNLI